MSRLAVDRLTVSPIPAEGDGHLATCEEAVMAKLHLLFSGSVVLFVAVLFVMWPARPPDAQQAPRAAVQIDADDIGGVVSGKNGPEAGVWVIAETAELGTRFAKMVVTDDQGR